MMLRKLLVNNYIISCLSSTLGAISLLKGDILPEGNIIMKGNISPKLPSGGYISDKYDTHINMAQQTNIKNSNLSESAKSESHSRITSAIKEMNNKFCHELVVV